MLSTVIFKEKSKDVPECWQPRIASSGHGWHLFGKRQEHTHTVAHYLTFLRIFIHDMRSIRHYFVAARSVSNDVPLKLL